MILEQAKGTRLYTEQLRCMQFSHQGIILYIIGLQ